jgi:hypothetical protein
MTPAARRSFRLAYAAWLLGIVAFFIPAATWNPVSRFDLTRAIVERHTLSIDAFASSTGDRSLVRGQWFTDKAPLPSLIAVPVYAALHTLHQFRGVRVEYRAYGNATTPAIRFEPNGAFQQSLYLCSLVTAGVSGVAIGVLLLELLARRTSSWAAFTASVVGVLGTPILPYATSFYGHVPAGAALLGALVALDTRGERFPTGLPPARRVRIAGACLALAPGCEYITAAPAALVGLWFLLRVPRRAIPRLALDLFAGALLPVLAVCAYHTAVYGAPWRTGYSFIARPEFAAGHAHGLLGINLPRLEALLGLSVSTRRGLFYLSPVLGVGFLMGAWRAVRTRDSTLVIGLACFLVLLCLNAGYYMWWGGASAGPRHLVPGVACVVAGVATALRRRRLWLTVLTLGLAVISTLNGLSITLVGLEAPELGNVLQSYVWPALRAGRFSVGHGASNIGIKFGLASALSPLPLLIWLTFGYWYLVRQCAPRQLFRLRLSRPPATVPAERADLRRELG